MEPGCAHRSPANLPALAHSLIWFRLNYRGAARLSICYLQLCPPARERLALLACVPGVPTPPKLGSGSEVPKTGKGASALPRALPTAPHSWRGVQCAGSLTPAFSAPAGCPAWPRWQCHHPEHHPPRPLWPASGSLSLSPLSLSPRRTQRPPVPRVSRTLSLARAVAATAAAAAVTVAVAAAAVVVAAATDAPVVARAVPGHCLSTHAVFPLSL